MATSKQRGLGRGIYSLFDDNVIESKKDSVTTLRISDIEPRSDQPRKIFEREALEQLADSIAAFGVLQPIIVRENTLLAGTYEIIAGERRWRASKMAGLSEIPVVIIDGDDLKSAQVALIENIQREDLNPVEEALAYNDLIEKFDLTQDQVAKQVGKSRSSVTNVLRLLDLPDEVLELVKAGTLSMGHARALLALETDEQMIELANRAIVKEMSVREVEKLVRLMLLAEQKGSEEPVMPADQVSELSQKRVYMKELEHRVTSTLGRRAKIVQTPKKRVLELAFDSDEDLEGLLTAICGKEIFSENN